MNTTARLGSWILGLTLMALVGCAPHQIYRTDYRLCEASEPETQCTAHALQRDTDDGYLLGFVEFDDQGQIFDRKQMDAVLTRIQGDAGRGDLLMVVFVHGWKHSAAPGDGNIDTFRVTLRELSAAETRIAEMQTKDAVPDAREVVGVYLGWRGGSITVPWLEQLTFWERKNTAHKVGQGGVTEVLNRLELVRRTRDVMDGNGASGTRLVVVGHSFGGAAVYSAVSPVLEHGFIHTPGAGGGSVTNAQGFGSLVVLINPAFEALRFTPLSDMATERGTYFDTQLPVLAILTSEADNATRLAFPAGRWLSTAFEKERDMTRSNGVTGEDETIDQGRANTRAVGHFEPYRTHYLSSRRAAGTDAPQALSAMETAQVFRQTRESWREDRPGSRIEFGPTLLERTEDSAGRNPYLVIRVSEDLIADHNDLSNPAVREFVKQLILISSQEQAR